uniref:Coiled-coil domain containing 33 n=1 Tax=Varanus komodoensis TaxID=61221 RepID=A0A8D2IUE7_VARKO
MSSRVVGSDGTNSPRSRPSEHSWAGLVKTTSEEESKQPAQAVTHVTAEPTHSPVWEEKVTVEVESAKAGEEVMSLFVADKDSKEVLAKYSIPVKYLRPFHQYHCALILPRKKDPVGTKLYATITRKGSLIPRYAGVQYTGLEVRGMPAFPNQLDGTCAVGANDSGNCFSPQRREMRARPLSAPHVPTTVINFPDPTMEDFDVPQVMNHGHPQVSPAGGPPEQPTWNTSFLFQGRDGATAFSDDTALVLEYYRASANPKPLGFSVLPLTNRVYRKLAADSSRNGVQVESLPIQVFSWKVSFLGLSSLLFSSLLFSSLLFSSLLFPSLPFPSLPFPSLPFPSLRLLPSAFCLLPSAFCLLPSVLSSSLLSSPLKWDSQESENYRAALQRMADDILSLRRHVANLEAENSTLRRSLCLHEDVGRALFQDIDLDVMTKQKLSSGAREMARMKDRVQKLQNELIRKNDREKDLVLLQRAHKQQQLMLRRCQAKIAKMQALEDAVRQQEKVTGSKRENLQPLSSSLFESRPMPAEPFSLLLSTFCLVPGDSWSKDLYSTLLMENMRLRDELGKSSYRAPIILQQQALPAVQGFLSDLFLMLFLSSCIITRSLRSQQDSLSSSTEKLSLISKLERAEARVHALECQLEDSSRRWGREKQDYNNRLLEQDLGFSRSPTSLIIQEFLQVSNPHTLARNMVYLGQVGRPSRSMAVNLWHASRSGHAEPLYRHMSQVAPASPQQPRIGSQRTQGPCAGSERSGGARR